jgi:hypothetical protein
MPPKTDSPAPADPVAAAMAAPPPPPPAPALSGPPAGRSGRQAVHPIRLIKEGDLPPVQPIAAGSRPAAPAREHNPLIDGPSATVNNARAQANALRQTLQTVFRGGEDALLKIAAVNASANASPEAAALFAAEGLDAAKLAELAADIEGVLSKYKPKQASAAAA